MKASSNLKQIRTFLKAKFTDETLRWICYDIPEFIPLYNSFTKATTATDVITKLLQYANTKQLPFKSFLTLVDSGRLTDDDKQPEDVASPDRINADSPATESGRSGMISDRAARSAGFQAQFNMSGNIQAGQINMGGEQTFEGPINVNIGDTIVKPDQAALNITTRLDKVIQMVERLPWGSEAQKKELVELMQALKSGLETVPLSNSQAADGVIGRVEALVSAVNTKKPDRKTAEIQAENLKRAGKDLPDVLPIVLKISTKIINYILNSG